MSVVAAVDQLRLNEFGNDPILLIIGKVLFVFASLVLMTRCSQSGPSAAW